MALRHCKYISLECSTTEEKKKRKKKKKKKRNKDEKQSYHAAGACLHFHVWICH